MVRPRQRHHRPQGAAVNRTTVLLAGLLLAACTPPAHAGFLTGRAEYDPATARYTYAYTLDNSAGPWPITEVSVLLAPNFVDYGLRPPAWTAPPGGECGTSTAGGIADPPYHE